MNERQMIAGGWIQHSPTYNRFKVGSLVVLHDGLSEALKCAAAVVCEGYTTTGRMVVSDPATREVFTVRLDWIAGYAH